jgi:hypothetical protein
MRIIPLFLGLVFAAVTPVFAEVASDPKTYSYQSSANSRESAEEKEDIGELVEDTGFKALRDKFRFTVSARSGYTTNALLDGSNGSSDLIFLPTLEAGFHTSLGQHFSFDLSTRVETVLYAKYDERAFAGYSALATLDYRIKEGLPRFYASVEPYRFDSFDTGDLLTQAIGFTGGVDWGIAFDGGHSLGFVGYSFTDYLADPTMDSRIVHRAIAGVAHQLRSNLTAQLYYLYQFSDYTDFDRHDSKHTIGGVLIYQFSDHWFGNWTSSFVDNSSTQNHASYESFSTTLGATFQF